MKTQSKQFGEWATGSDPNLFSRARLKLSVLYLLIIAVILLLFTVGIYSSFRDRLGDNIIPKPGQSEHLNAEDRSTYDRALDDIRELAILADVVIFIIAGFLSYILAGYTLKPIKDALDAQTAFSADASHELRTPLSVIRTNTELILKESGSQANKNLSDTARHMLEINLAEVQSMTTMSDQLLALARGQYESNKSFTKIQFNDVVLFVLEAIKTVAENKNISLSFGKIEPVMVIGNQNSLRRMVQNIISNAITYTPNGGSVTVNLVVSSGQAHLSVADTGVGIPEKDLPHIFERFYKVDYARTDTNIGSGLGLAIVQQIVQMHKGKINISNSINGKNGNSGVIVNVYLPCV